MTASFYDEDEYFSDDTITTQDYEEEEEDYQDFDEIQDIKLMLQDTTPEFNMFNNFSTHTLIDAISEYSYVKVPNNYGPISEHATNILGDLVEYILGEDQQVVKDVTDLKSLYYQLTLLSDY